MKASQIFFAIFLSAALLISFPSFSQFGIGVGFGAKQMNVSKLNEFNRNNNLPEINQFQFLTNLSFIIGTKYYFIEMNNEIVSGTTDNNDHMIENLAHFAILNMAYNLSKNEKYRIYPLAGFGYGYQKLDFTDKSTGSNTFTNFIQSQAKTRSIKNENIVIRLGAGWMYRLGPINPDKKTMGESIGLQIGYNLPVYQTTWMTADMKEVTDVPTVNTQGFYAKLSLQFF